MDGKPYIAELQRVREVTLTGVADLGYWHDRLAADGLCPIEADGHARVTIGCTAARYVGLPADECVIAVHARPTGDAAGRDGMFLIQGYNASRLFAWFERNWFGTPYLHGSPSIEADPHFELPIEVRLAVGELELFSACLRGASGDRSPAWSGKELWEGPIYLPAKVARRSATEAEPNRGANPPVIATASLAAGKFFFARLGGLTHKYPFDPAIDRLTTVPISTAPAWSMLLESGFTPREWSIRPGATHARSKTYRRNAIAEL